MKIHLPLKSHTLAATRSFELEPEVRGNLRLAAQSIATPQAGRDKQLEAASGLCQPFHSFFNVSNNLEQLPLGAKLSPILPLLASREFAKFPFIRKMNGRGGGDRTHDLRLKRPLLYH